MALVCDIESASATAAAPEETAAPQEPDNDLEDGEIEDDGEDDIPVEPAVKENDNTSIIATNNAVASVVPSMIKEKVDRDRPPRHERSDRRRHDEKKKHMTEAEKSILHLRKRERMQREKWEKYRKEQTLDPPDDFAINIEKAIASVLNKKDKHNISDEEIKDDEKRGRKRKNRDKDRQKGNKQRKTDSPKSEDIDENEFLNVRGGSPNKLSDDKKDRSPTPTRSEESYDSEYSSDRSKSDDRRDRKRDYKKGKGRNRDRNRKKSRERNRQEQQQQQQFKDAQGVCVFFLQGKCQKNDCPYSHEAVPPMKLELCKFYLKDCCAKGEKCSYMHSEFPCKFYHTGLVCLQGDNCKFAHGRPLDEHRKQILFKHIETAPREILGGFPRMSREEALNKINVAQQNLMVLYGTGDKKDDKGLIPSLFEINVPVPSELNSEDANKPKPEKPPRNRPSRWQDPDPIDQLSQVQVPPPAFPLNFSYGGGVQDQDMRVNSNGDIDMRTLPPLAQIAPPQTNQLLPPSVMDDASDHDATNFTQDIDIRNPNMLQFDTRDVDIRHQTMDPRLLATKDVDIRQIPTVFDDVKQPQPQQQQQLLQQQPPQQQQQQQQQDQAVDDDDEEESQLQIDTGEVPEEETGPPPNLPKTQRELYMRIQSQQKTNLPEEQQQEAFEMDDNINWYSDDDDEDENRLTIKVDNEEEKKDKDEESESGNIMSPPQVKPLEVVEKLGDLSKIDISAEVTKLLTSISQTASSGGGGIAAIASTPKEPPPTPRVNRDPRQQPQPSSTMILSDPRQQRHEPPKISIYEQGSIPTTTSADEPRSPDDLIESDFRSRPDVDLRNLHLPFKGMLNYTPAKEIDASVNSHPPMTWRIHVVDVPRPDYTGLKLNVQDAEKTGDPRLKKIFRLSSNTDDKDSPASPKASPKATVTRIDPRLKKLEESKQQQQEGALTYNQQLNILQSSAFFQSLTSNQKLLLNQELASRNDQNGYHDPVLNSVLSTLNLIPNQTTNNPNMGAALSILAKLNPPTPMMNTAAAAPVLRQNPNLMNQMAQSMVQPGLLGAAPGIPNLPADFPINFPPTAAAAVADPRGGVGMGPFGNFPPDSFGGGGGGGNFDDYYPPPQDNNFGHGRDTGRNFNRDRRRGRNNFNRNAGNRNFRNRNNRANRSHTPP